ncbi:hypothetical protein NA56DRAFT_658969 [Hyaloscypha hepaticicola]|uniref:Nephrocystin 3-like N-terminal domain-containing protein n=1 Tax=Hyaloscypha hepaticicola TaxID=2082293 RepID=A0A2J6Q586_9HELO|nr:hypothetical protein NA56DRAFT_658969 [Hyaloscypha hepaticicola]
MLPQIRQSLPKIFRILAFIPRLSTAAKFTMLWTHLNEEIKEEITLAAEKEAAKEREDASKYRTSGLVFRSELKQLSREARERSLGKEKRRAEAQRQKLLDKLSSHDYISPLKRIRKKRYRTTSTWVTENESFKNWLDDTKSGIFWLSGILGSGKSVVCAATRGPEHVHHPAKCTSPKSHNSLSLNNHKMVNEEDIKAALAEIELSEDPNYREIARKFKLTHITLL